MEVGLGACILKGCYFPNARGKPESLALSFDFNSSCQSGQESLTSRAQHGTPARSIREKPPTHRSTFILCPSVKPVYSCKDLVARLSRLFHACTFLLFERQPRKLVVFFHFFLFFSRVKTKTHCTPSARTSQLKAAKCHCGRGSSPMFFPLCFFRKSSNHKSSRHAWHFSRGCLLLFYVP